MVSPRLSTETVAEETVRDRAGRQVKHSEREFETAVPRLGSGEFMQDTVCERFEQGLLLCTEQAGCMLSATGAEARLNLGRGRNRELR
jgi:hypothetical protein